MQVDQMHATDVWIHIDGHEESSRLQWEHTRMICFTVARYACDQKGFPKTPQAFWPFPWDEQGCKPDSKSILESHARMVAKRKLLEGRIIAKS
jgi:hypothetical protein